MRLISDGFGSEPLAVGASRSLSPSRMSLHSFTHSLQMYTEGPDTRRATSSWPRPQNEQRIGCGVAMRFFMRLPGLLSLLDDLVDQAVLPGFVRDQEVVPVGVLKNLDYRMPA